MTVRDCKGADYGIDNLMEFKFHTLDVFTAHRFGGNPLAVVLDADQLNSEQMQAVAREFNLSETVFLCKAESPAHSARMRIFTPNQELSFAGHPSIGTAALLSQQRAPDTPGENDSIVTLEQGIGLIRVGVRLLNDGNGHQSAFAEFDAPKLPQVSGELPAIEKLAAAVGLIPSEIGFENHRPAMVSAGNGFAFIPVSTLEAMAKAHINSQHWHAAFGNPEIVGAYLYSRKTQHTTSDFHARMFAPGAGIGEDPATGSAAVGLAGVVHRFDGLPDGLHKRVIEQGYEMNRPSHIEVTLAVSGSSLQAVRIGGQSVRVSNGTIYV